MIKIKRSKLPVDRGFPLLLRAILTSKRATRYLGGTAFPRPNMLVNFTGLPELQHLPCRATMALNKTFPLNVVLVMNLEQNNPQCAQSVVRRLHEAGHHITLFACSSKGRLTPILKQPLSPMTGSVSQKPEDMLRDKICEADAVILITDYHVYEVPENVKCVVEHLDGDIYSWISYGLTCSLLGGMVHDRQVAIQISWLLEDSQNLIVGRILPQPRYFDLLYSVDPMLETAEPCVL